MPELATSREFKAVAEEGELMWKPADPCVGEIKSELGRTGKPEFAGVQRGESYTAREAWRDLSLPQRTDPSAHV